MKLQTDTKRPVRTIMTSDPVSIEASADARELARVLADNKISGVPVVDTLDRVIGVVSRTDLLMWCVSGGLGISDEDLLTGLAEGRDAQREIPADLGIVEDFMSNEAIVAGPDESIAAVAQRMADNGVHRIIIVSEDNTLVGIVSSLDMIRALAH